MCPKLDATQQRQKFPWKQRFELEIGSVIGTKNCAGRRESHSGGRFVPPIRKPDGDRPMGKGLLGKLCSGQACLRKKASSGQARFRQVTKGLVKSGKTWSNQERLGQVRKGLAPWSRTARPAACRAGRCGFWRNRRLRRAASGRAAPAPVPTTRGRFRPF
jgi:hypothetical protein